MRRIAFQVVAYTCIFALVAFALTEVFPSFRQAIARTIGLSRLSHPPLATTQPEQNEHADWKFDYNRDSDNHGLSEEQCQAAFPLLTKEIDRAVEYRHQVGNITLNDLGMAWRSHGILRVLIRDNRLYIVNTLNVERGHRTRYLATLNSINTALLSYPGRLPPIEFTFCVQDNPIKGEGNENRVTLGYTRQAEQESVWLMPDFGFWGWPKVGMPSYPDLRNVIEDSEIPFLDKIPKLVWRGSINQGEDTRKALVQQSKDQSWSDVRELKWRNEDDVTQHRISMEGHCGYMFTAMTEGVTWSGRLKLLLNCHSVVVSHRLQWIEFYHHLLSEAGDSQNYVVLDREFSGLNEKMEHLLEPETLRGETRRIADNLRRTFREQYLTPAAISCYWRALFRGWASVQGFEPKLWEDAEDSSDKESQVRRRPRGTPFESYTIMEALEWEVPAQPRKLVLNDKIYYP